MKKFLLIIFILLTCLRGYSQTSVSGVFSSSGGNGQTDKVQLSWTVGEPFVGTLSSKAGSLIQGFFYLASSLVTSVDDPEAVQSLRVFPNPATNRITVEVPSLSGGYYLRVLDAVGRVKVTEFLTGVPDKIVDVSLLPSGMYYVQLLNADSKTIKNSKFLIVK